MKTFLLTTLTLAGIAVSTPEAQAKKHKDKDRHHDRVSYYSERPSCESRSYRTEYYPREYSRRTYYYAEPRPRYYREEPCHVERRHSFRPPLISFLFGF